MTAIHQASTPVVEPPPWSTPDRLGIRKKPPPVPKPRYAQGRAFALSNEEGQESQPSKAPVPAAATATQRRWGQLGEDVVAHMEQAHTGGGSESAAPPPAHTHRSGELPPDYKACWHRWQAMPASLEEKRQELLRPVAAQSPPRPPTKEALAFLEQLLSGTEPSSAAGAGAAKAEFGRRKDVAEGTEKVLVGALRLQAQAEALRRRRMADRGCRGHSSAFAGAAGAAASSPGRTAADTGASRHARKDTGKSPVARAGAGVDEEGVSPKDAASRQEEAGSDADYQRRMQERQEEHERLIRNCELEAEKERQRLLQEMEREQLELEARRHAQDAWREELEHKTDQRRREAELEAKAEEGRRRRQHEAWQQRWWKEWRRAEEQAKQKEQEQRQWARDWWEQWKDQQEPHEEHEFEEDSDFSGRAPPPFLRPPPASASSERPEHKQVLQQLLAEQRKPLEQRKRVWRYLCLQWHPDKCEDKEVATAMFQYLQCLKDWFLASDS